MIPLASPRRLKRLQRIWANLDATSRSQALSEYALLLLSSEGISTARLEELIWKRMRIPNESTDLASILHQHVNNWPTEANDAVLHAGKVLDEFLKSGRLPSSTV